MIKVNIKVNYQSATIKVWTKAVFLLPCLICGFPLFVAFLLFHSTLGGSRKNSPWPRGPRGESGNKPSHRHRPWKNNGGVEGTGTTRSTRGKLLAKWIKKNRPNDIEYIKKIWNWSLVGLAPSAKLQTHLRPAAQHQSPHSVGSCISSHGWNNI